jgi:RNA 2',3'-cyclic 3'-phosphodiesterase
MFSFCSIFSRPGKPEEIAMDGSFEFYRELPRRPKRPERLFFATLAGAAGHEIAERRDMLISENGLNGAPIKTERLHLSYHHVGDYARLPPTSAYAGTQAGHAVSMPSFEVAFSVIASFEAMPRRDGRPPRWPVVLGGEGDELFELHKTLGAAMQRFGLKTVEHFVPHMTLFYSPRPITPRTIKPIRLRVNEFCLIHSEVGLTRYNILHRWRLKS